MKYFIPILIITVLILAMAGIIVQANSAAPLLVLEAEEAELGGNASISGQKVGNIGLNGGSNEGTVTFYDLDLPEDGTYTLMLHYYSGSDDRNFDIRTDVGEFHIECPNTGSFDTVGTIPMEIELTKGGYITIGSYWYGPDLDKIEIYEADAFDFEDKEYENADNVTYGENVKLILDKQNGVYSIAKGEDILLSNAHCEVRIDNETIASDEFTTHTVSEEDGTITFTHTNRTGTNIELIQTFTIQNDYVLTRVTAKSDYSTLETNYIAPMALYPNSVDVQNGVFLQIPFDNDAWVEPKFIGAESLSHTVRSYEVAAYFNEYTSAGVVLGSVEHDVWKTGIQIHAEDSEIMGLSLYNGIADSNTRDKAPHGSVSGKTVSSSLSFIGCYDDWQAGLTAYAKANTDVVPAKQSSTTDVPFGFNSWGSLQGTVNYSTMVAIADYIEKYLQPVWGEDGATVYINIDSYWDHIVKNDSSCNMTLDEALAAFVAVCEENGQKAGIYFTPFSAWVESEADLKNATMEGSDYSFYDAALRNADGSLYGKLNKGFALDATHPGTLARIENRMNYFISLGFSYVKLDFLTHGALEGKHYDSSVSTGMQAYNLAMAKIHELCNEKMFVNLSIAPIFPYQYADGRRISCDAFDSINNSKHVLSYLTAGFWQKELYTYPDPDHLVVQGSSEGTARVRVTVGAISGTSFIIGDNLSYISEGSYDHNHIMKMYANKGIVSVAKLGKAFKPLSVSAGDRCASVYYYIEGDDLYLAVFNFNHYTDTLAISLSDLAENIDNTATELWRNEQVIFANDTLSYTLKGEDAALFHLTLNGTGINSEIPDNNNGNNNNTPGGNNTNNNTTENNAANNNNATTPDSQNEENTSDSGIAGWIVGIVVAIVALAAGWYFLFAKKKS